MGVIQDAGMCGAVGGRELGAQLARLVTMVGKGKYNGGGGDITGFDYHCGLSRNTYSSSGRGSAAQDGPSEGVSYINYSLSGLA